MSNIKMPTGFSDMTEQELNYDGGADTGSLLNMGGLGAMIMGWTNLPWTFAATEAQTSQQASLSVSSASLASVSSASSVASASSASLGSVLGGPMALIAIGVVLMTVYAFKG